MNGNENWYKSDVKVQITPGTDTESPITKTSYVITGAQETDETDGTDITITNEGISYITAYTYNEANLKTASEQFTVKKDTQGPVFSGLEYATFSYYDDPTFRNRSNCI